MNVNAIFIRIDREFYFILFFFRLCQLLVHRNVEIMEHAQKKTFANVRHNGLVKPVKHVCVLNL